MHTSLRLAVLCEDKSINEKELHKNTFLLCHVQNLRQLDLTDCLRLGNLPSAMAGELCIGHSLSKEWMRTIVSKDTNHPPFWHCLQSGLLCGDF